MGHTLSIIFFTIFIFQVKSCKSYSNSEIWQMANDGCGLKVSKGLPNDVCAILFDDNNCDKYSYNVLETYGKPEKVPWERRNQLQSLIVNKGCILQVFKDENCQEDSYIFPAPDKDKYLYIKEIDETNASDFEKENECVKCSCSVRWFWIRK